jgi:gamma-glutamyltranspeptidase / glutathione hydrolase
MAFGTPGGEQQDQWSLVFLLSHLQYGLNLQQAIARRPSTPHFPELVLSPAAQPGQIELESSVGEDVIRKLRRRGHDMGVTGPGCWDG